jgi:putative transposase
MSKTRNKFSPEVRERAVRMVGEHRADYGSEWEAMTSIASKIGCTAETLRRRQSPAQAVGARGQETAAGQRDPAQGIGVFCAGGASQRPLAPRQMVMSFIDAHREDLGIEPICRELAVAPSSYHEHARR